MRFFKNLYKSALAATVGVLALTGCQPEESPLARAIMTSVSGLEFAAQNAEPQTIQVYADADWTVEAPEWVTVDKMEGSRSMEVTISVGDNMRGGAIDNPKKDTIVFRGYNLLAHAYVIVMQDGDKYRDVPATDVAGILTMKDEDVVILDDAQVVAASTKGFVVSDGTAEAFVVSSETVAVGDKVDIKGSKGTWNELPAVTICDEVNVTGNAAVTYPSPTDITASIDTYAPSKMELVEITGSLEGMNVLVEGAARVGVVLDPTDDINVNELNGHNVTVKGYSAGATVSVVNVIATEIVDLGVNEIIYYADDFEWFADLALTEGAGDAVGTDDEVDQEFSRGRSVDVPNLRISDSTLPEISDPESLIQILRHGDYLRHSKEEIVSFLTSDKSDAEKAEYVKSAYPPLLFAEFYKQGTEDHLGYRADDESLLLYTGSFTSRTAENRMDWAFVTRLIEALITDKNYLDKPVVKEDHQMSLFDMDMPEVQTVAESTPQEKADITSQMRISQEVIDELLRLGGCTRNSNMRIYEYYRRAKGTHMFCRTESH